MENSKEEIPFHLKVKYLNDNNKNLLEIAKHIFTNPNISIEETIEENNITKPKNKSDSKKKNLNYKGLSLFEKMNIIEENNKDLETKSKESKKKNDESKKINIFANLYKTNIIKLNYLCDIHNKSFNSFCKNCNKNLCVHCIEYSDVHKNHEINYFTKYFLSKIKEKEYKIRLASSHLSLTSLKKHVLDICSSLIDMNEIILKNKVKRAYIKYYKQNYYQVEYAKFVYSRYILQKEISLLNYQILCNLYHIKFNNVIFPHCDLDVKEKALALIKFLSKTENYILLQSYSTQADLANSIIFKYQELKKNLKNKDNKIKNIVNDNKETKDIIIQNQDNEIFYEQEKEIKDKAKINNDIEKFEIQSIGQTKITTTTSIFLTNSSIKLDSNKNLIGKKTEKKFKKITKKIIPNKFYNKAEKIYKEIREQLSYEYLNFIEENPPLNDGVEVKFYKEIKFMYTDKANNKIIYSIYQGECKKDTQIRHGRGFFKWGDGEKYIGYWINNKRDGIGTNYYNNGNIYEGMFKNGKKEGRGKYKWKNGDIYDGEWKNGVKEGKGIYITSNGEIYNGLFVNDKINGQGVYTWKNKNQYKGDFKNNIIEGEGILFRKKKKKGEDDSDITEAIKIITCGKSVLKELK